MDKNPYKAPDEAGLPKKRPGSLDPLQYIGVLVLAVLVVIAFALVEFGLGVFNSWLLGR
jgi:hypothetical protein